jgi:hypothetical protein
VYLLATTSPFHECILQSPFAQRHWYSGACPIDMLHTILLGLFPGLDRFRPAKASDTTKDLDALMEYGELYARHSEQHAQDKVLQGITGGKIMAKEYEESCFVTTIVRCSKGRLLKSARSKKFKEDDLATGLALLLETLFGWIEWLARLKKKHVKAPEWKHRYLMFLIKRVIRRTEGMGMKFPNFTNCCTHRIC